MQFRLRAKQPLLLSLCGATFLATSVCLPVPERLVRAAEPPARPLTTSTAASGSDASPLREIGRVHVTTPLCKALLQRADTGIAAVLSNDTRLLKAEDTLRTIDLDTNVITKFNGAAALRQQYVELRRAAVEGNAIMQHFREDAASAPTATQKDVLLRFADALDGALHRQKVLADTLSRFVVYVDTHDPLDSRDNRHDRTYLEIARLQQQAYAVHPNDPLHDEDTPIRNLTDGARVAAVVLEERARPVLADEKDAGDRIEAAFTKC